MTRGEPWWRAGRGRTDQRLVSVVVFWTDGSARARVDAVLAQTHRELEVLVVAATADAPSVVTGLAHFDPRVRLAGTTTDLGVGLAQAVELAGGELITFADKEWTPGWLAGRLAQLQAAGASVLLGDGLGDTVLTTQLARQTGIATDLGAGAVADFLTRLPGAGLQPLKELPAGVRAQVLATRELHWSEASAVVPGRVGLIVPVRADLAAATALLTQAEELPETELVFVGFESDAQHESLRQAQGGRELIGLVRSAADSWALLADLGAQHSTGEVLVFVGPGAVLTAAAVAPLVAALEDPEVAIAQPLNQRLHLTVASAGAYFAPGQVVPVELLAGHPLPDAELLGDGRLPATSSAVVAVRRADFLAVGGFDPAFGNSLAEVDLSLRLAAAGCGAAQLVNAARVTARSRAKAGFGHDLAASAALLRQRWANPPSGSADVLAAAGFAVAGHEPRPLTGSTEGQFVAAPRLAPTRSLEGEMPSFRWAIDIAATATWWGERWGDRYFAYSLAAALRRLGQQVAVDHREVRDRETRALDDVVLVLRGMDQVTPKPGPINLLWVISHPDEVTAAEASAFDLVFAAGQRWAAERAQEWALPVRPLLQCTDAALFHPGLAGEAGAGLLFVGNARDGASRPVVDYALAAGADLTLYGTGWEHTPAAAHRVAEIAPNAELGRLYANAGVVLNDHWATMRESGFLANRLFDAVACGARVLSDQVEGAEELFGGSVRSFTDADDFARLLADPQASWPDREQRLANAQRVLAEHTFDRRAEQLLAAAIEVHQARRGGLQAR